MLIVRTRGGLRSRDGAEGRRHARAVPGCSPTGWTSSRCSRRSPPSPATTGMVDYCAANNFMDALARRLNAEGVPVHSIGWASWRTVGMVMATENAAPTIFRELEVGTRSVPVEHPLLDRRILDGSGDVVVATTLTPSSHWVVTDHQIGGVGVLPGTASLEIIHAALRLVEGGGDSGKSAEIEISDVVFLGPVVIAEPRELRATLRPDAGGYDVTIVAGRACATGSSSSGPSPPATPCRTISTHCARTATGCGTHRSAVARTTAWSSSAPTGRTRSSCRSVPRTGEAGRIELDSSWPIRDEYTLHPAAGRRGLPGAVPATAVAEATRCCPFSYGRVTVRAPVATPVPHHVRHLDDGAGQTVSCDIALHHANTGANWCRSRDTRCGGSTRPRSGRPSATPTPVAPRPSPGP